MVDLAHQLEADAPPQALPTRHPHGDTSDAHQLRPALPSTSPPLIGSARPPRSWPSSSRGSTPDPVCRRFIDKGLTTYGPRSPTCPASSSPKSLCRPLLGEAPRPPSPRGPDGGQELHPPVLRPRGLPPRSRHGRLRGSSRRPTRFAVHDLPDCLDAKRRPTLVARLFQRAASS